MSRIQIIHASVQTAITSDAENPCVCNATNSASAFLSFGSKNPDDEEKSIGSFCISCNNIDFRVGTSGRCNTMHFSSRPGRRKAGSIHFGLCVIPITAILPSSPESEEEGRTSKPSISIKTVLNKRSIVPSVVLSCPRTGAICSIPSNKIIQGAAAFAAANNFCTARSDPPTSLCIKDVQLTSSRRREGRIVDATAAQCLARMVLPDPGGPVRRVPAHTIFPPPPCCRPPPPPLLLLKIPLSSPPPNKISSNSLD
mmetsp:Transcript_38063/g.55604  ORF Transcript_38063/g.55604 Transcript_38063/m.55604 type:complete len:255 (+) Transcript_38063:270-1034(+)